MKAIESAQRGSINESFLEFFGGLGGLILETGAKASLRGIGDGRQEICCGLSLGAFESEVNEVLLGVFGGPREDLAALVDDQHLVHQLVDALAGLVQGHKAGMGQRGKGAPRE